MVRKTISKGWWKKVFLLLAIGWAVTFFWSHDYRSVTELHPFTLTDPRQVESDEEPIVFTRNGYRLVAESLYDYEISGLVVSKFDYTWFSVYKRNKVFPVDLCVVWGDNLKEGVFRSRKLRFSQDMRFCFYRYVGDIDVTGSQLSNNHLLVDSDKLEEVAKSVRKGDQVRVRGKLVNVTATKLEKDDSRDPNVFKWASSVKREDTGGGACETIYVEEIEVLREGHPIARRMNKYAGYGMGILLLVGAVWVFRPFT